MQGRPPNSGPYRIFFGAWRHGASAAYILASTAAAALVSTAAVAQQASTSTALEEIVVTAQKREQSLQNVPVAVTAITSESIENSRIAKVEDIAHLAPNVNVGEGVTVAGPLNPLISIRGIASQNNGLVQVDSAIAMYVDGVYLGRATGANFDVAEIERIEVLRGPQGTLFGRNAVGGAINVITKAPRGKLHVRQDLSVGNLGEFRAKTRLDLPAFAGLSSAFTFAHMRNDGYVKNAGSGVRWDVSQTYRGKLGQYRTSARDLGSKRSNAVFADLKWVPERIDGLTAEYKIDYARIKSVQGGIQSMGLVNSTAANATIRFLPPPYGTCVGNCAVGPILINPKPSNLVNNEAAFEVPSTVWGHSLAVDYEATDWLRMKNITAFRQFGTAFATELGAGNYLLDPTNGQPFINRLSAFFQGQHQFSNETNFTATSDIVDVTAGVMYYKELTEYFGRVISLTTLPNFVFPINNPANTAYATNKSLAEYGEVTVHLLDSVDAVGGFRHTWEDRRSEDPEMPVLNGRQKSSRNNWLVGLNYRPLENALVYGKISTGYISGGTYLSVPFGPQTIKQTELGVKADLLDKRLRVNTAGFWATMKGFQNFAFTPALCNGSAAGCLINVGTANLYGAEAEITALPMPGLQLNANIGWLRLEADPVVAGVVNSSLAPKWTLRFAAQYTFPYELATGTPSIGVDASYRSRVPWGGAGPAGPVGFQDNSYTPAFWSINARATLADVEVGSGRAKLSVWGKNLTDKQHFSFILAGVLNAQVIGQISPPATYGLDFSYEF